MARSGGLKRAGIVAVRVGVCGRARCARVVVRVEWDARASAEDVASEMVRVEASRGRAMRGSARAAVSRAREISAERGVPLQYP